VPLDPRYKYVKLPCGKCGGSGYTGKRAPGRPGSPFDAHSKRGRCSECLGRGEIEVRIKPRKGISPISQAILQDASRRFAPALRRLAKS
jgi:hypothetical protein